MLSATGRAATTTTAKRVAQLVIFRSGSQHRHLSTSSAFADFNFVPNSIREAVKSSVLDEATKPDSKLWNDQSSSSLESNLSPKRMNGTHGSKERILPNSSFSKQTNGSLNGSHNVTHQTDINHPISSLPLLLDDPLNEWHLNATPHYNIPTQISNNADPFQLSKSDLENLSSSIRNDLIQSDHPVLNKVASYFFEKGQEGGKKVRPMMVMLLSRAMDLSPPPSHHEQRHDVLEAQHRLAEISEMIHTASLFHDDVIDGSDTRRGAPAVHKVFGNKMAILAGDYLLARASICLARLRDVEVVETMSTIIEHLVRGEVMQMKANTSREEDENGSTNVQMEYYLRKNFYKTASLMANSCKSAAILGGYDDYVVSAAYRYGKHVGMAFQLVDDVLDFDGTEKTLGKPALADLNAGLATAPVLFAAELYPDVLQPLIQRKFRERGDVDVAMDYVRRSDGIQRTKNLAQVHAELAVDAVMELERNEYRDSLVHLAFEVVGRSR